MCDFCKDKASDAVKPGAVASALAALLGNAENKDTSSTSNDKDSSIEAADGKQDKSDVESSSGSKNEASEDGKSKTTVRPGSGRPGSARPGSARSARPKSGLRKDALHAKETSVRLNPMFNDMVDTEGKEEKNTSEESAHALSEYCIRFFCEHEEVGVRNFLVSSDMRVVI